MFQLISGLYKDAKTGALYLFVDAQASESLVAFFAANGVVCELCENALICEEGNEDSVNFGVDADEEQIRTLLEGWQG